MLMRFSISNFMSFGYKTDEQQNIVPDEFYLYAGTSEQHKERVIHFAERKVLKFSSVYGANASGKTNLISAIDAGKQILLRTMAEKEYEEKYCRSRKSNQDMPTMFEYEFTIGQRCFAYGFTVNLSSSRILTEWLYEMEGKKEHTIYERIAENKEYYFDEAIFQNSENRQQFDYFIKDANRIQNSLLLYEIRRRNLEDKEFEIFLKIYDWFKHKLMIVHPNTKMMTSFTLFGRDDDRLAQILDYLDTGITGYEMREIKEDVFRQYFSAESDAEKFLKKPEPDNPHKILGFLITDKMLFALEYGRKGLDKISKLMFQHGQDESRYEFGEESDGTKRLIELLAVILNDDEEKVFLIDELDRSLHPQMTVKFVETFLRFSENKSTQLIISTHESSLMDLKILRRDEIWFAEREHDNTTVLYALEKFKIRYDKSVSKDYLAGRYGAVPVFKDFEYVWGRQ